MLAERETLEPGVGAFSDSLPALAGEHSPGHVTQADGLHATEQRKSSVWSPEGLWVTKHNKITQRRQESRALRDVSVVFL